MKKRQNCYRKQQGQALVLGVAILILMAASAVGFIFVLLNAGMTMLYKQKIHFIAEQTAMFFVTRASGWNFENSMGVLPNVDNFAKGLAGTMGMNSSAFTAAVVPTGGAGNAGTFSLTVTGSNLPIFGGMSLPGWITLSETYNADNTIFPRPTGLLEIVPTTGGIAPVQCYVPCYSSKISGVVGPGTGDQFTLIVDPSNLTANLGTRGTTP